VRRRVGGEGRQKHNGGDFISKHLKNCVVTNCLNFIAFALHLFFNFQFYVN